MGSPPVQGLCSPSHKLLSRFSTRHTIFPVKQASALTGKQLIAPIINMPLLQHRTKFSRKVSNRNMQGLEPVETLDVFSAPAILFSTFCHHVSQKAWKWFPVQPWLIFMWSASKEHGVFNNRVLSTSSGGQPRIMSVACVILCASEGHPGQ